jgi:hypothetical protein
MDDAVDCGPSLVTLTCIVGALGLGTVILGRGGRAQRPHDAAKHALRQFGAEDVTSARDMLVSGQAINASDYAASVPPNHGATLAARFARAAATPTSQSFTAKYPQGDGTTALLESSHGEFRVWMVPGAANRPAIAYEALSRGDHACALWSGRRRAEAVLEVRALLDGLTDLDEIDIAVIHGAAESVLPTRHKRRLSRQRICWRVDEVQ